MTLASLQELIRLKERPETTLESLAMLKLGRSLMPSSVAQPRAATSVLWTISGSA